VFGLFTNWFRAPALLIGWAVGFVGGSAIAWTDGLKPLHSLVIGGTAYTVYVGLLALVGNLVVAVLISALMNAASPRPAAVGSA
jgi:SSS family solute:Na+ symporter